MDFCLFVFDNSQPEKTTSGHGVDPRRLGGTSPGISFFRAHWERGKGFVLSPLSLRLSPVIPCKIIIRHGSQSLPLYESRLSPVRSSGTVAAQRFLLTDTFSSIPALRGIAASFQPYFPVTAHARAIPKPPLSRAHTSLPLSWTALTGRHHCTRLGPHGTLVVHMQAFIVFF